MTVPPDVLGLQTNVVRLAALTTGAVAAATDAILAADLVAAQAVIDDDDAVDALCHLVEDDCFELLGAARSEASDVAFVVATLRVAHELERSADLMVNVAKTTGRLRPHRLDTTASQLIERMARQAAVQLRVAVNAFVDRDTSSAAALPDMDEEMDELERRLVHHALREERDGEVASPGHTDHDDAVLVRAVHLGLVARHYERVGDHAVTIAQEAPWVVTGSRRSRRPRRAPSIVG